MTLSPEDIIRGGSLPTASVEICMDAGLTAEHERLDRQLQEALNAPRDSLASGSNATELSKQIKALEERMREHTVTFTLSGLPRPKWRKIVADHPPRRAEDGSVDERDRRADLNVDSFFEDIIRACTVEPELSDETWRLLLDERLTDGQYESLANAAWGLNRHDVDVPFSSAASKTRNSARR